jgi:hypothetical protein
MVVVCFQALGGLQKPEPSKVLAILGLVAFIGIASFFAWDRDQMCRALVEGDLRRYHATDIDIKLDWLDFDRDTFTYDVQYRDRAGEFHRNRCKVTSGRYAADEAVYWTDPISPSAA